jgi:hypothetical protein
MNSVKIRRSAAVGALALALAGWLIWGQASWEPEVLPQSTVGSGELAVEALGKLEVKGRAPKTGYKREEFYKSWGSIDGCDVRNVILKRDMWDVQLDGCAVVSGMLNDPYTGQVIEFVRGPGTSAAVQIDHVVAISDAWAKGAQYMDKAVRYEMSQDPLNLLAVDGPANQQKGDGDAATWLPSNKGFRCEYVARQIAVKRKYSLWVTEAERDAMAGVLTACPEERLIVKMGE